MKIAFYGIASRVGTSANMAVIAEVFRCCQEMVIQHSPEFFCEHSSVVFQDYSHRKDEIRRNLKGIDLIVVNLPDSVRKFENIFYQNSYIQKNVIFLFGKYFQNNEKMLWAFAKNYRIDRNRICAIPYNLRFQQAYENHRLSAYLTQTSESLEDENFKKNLCGVLRAILTYAEKNE